MKKVLSFFVYQLLIWFTGYFIFYFIFKASIPGFLGMGIFVSLVQTIVNYRKDIKKYNINRKNKENNIWKEKIDKKGGFNNEKDRKKRRKN